MKEFDKYQYEKAYWLNNQLVCGLDEAGRGPLFGALVVAGVVFDIGYCNDEIDDSKKLSAKKRKQLFHQIIKDAKAYYIEVVDVRSIDILNIYQATKRAMTKIALNSQADVVFSDAMPLDIAKDHLSIIKGDQKSISIAAASIVAKTVRDEIMHCADFLYPKYGFKKHKGYPTKLHLENIQKLVLLDDYRKSYGPIKNILGL